MITKRTTERIKRAVSIIAFIIILSIPFAVQAKSGYFQPSKDGKRIEYRLSNSKRSGTLTLTRKGNVYTIENGYLTLINGNTYGYVKAKNKKTYYIENSVTFSGLHANKLYKNGRVNTKANGKVKVGGIKYYFKKGKLFTGIANKRYYTRGLRDKTKTGKFKIKGKKYYFYQGKIANGIVKNRYYANGRVDKKKTGIFKIKGVKYYIKKGKLYNGLYKKIYYKNGVRYREFSGFIKYKKKQYYVYAGKLANGLHGRAYYKNGRVNKKINGYKKIGGYKYYFIKGVIADPTVAHPLKILMVGNSYTYYNGYPQMLSQLIAKTNKSALVVRATKGDRSIPQLMEQQLSYVAWKDGKQIASGSNTYLKDIMKIDFGSLNRAGKWDYIICQNNEDDSTKLSAGDIKFFNMVKGSIPNSKRFLIHGMYYSTTISNKRYNEHMKAVTACNCSIINSVAYYNQYNTYFNASEKSKWRAELTLMDSDHHPSGRGGYLLALCIYAKIFGVNSYARNETDTLFIPLYNKEGGSTKEFAPDKFKQKDASDFAMSVTALEAKRLQAYVRTYADEYIGAPLFIQDYNLNV